MWNMCRWHKRWKLFEEFTLYTHTCYNKAEKDKQADHHHQPKLRRLEITIIDINFFTIHHHNHHYYHNNHHHHHVA